MSRSGDQMLAHIVGTTEIGREDIAALDIDAVCRQWDRVRGECFAPTLRAFRLDELPPALVPRMAIVDFVGPPLDYFYRFFGTGMTEIAGQELTGKTYYADKIEGYGFVNAKLFPVLIETKSPMFHQITWESVKGLLFVTTTARLPLSNDGSQVTGAITANVFRSGAPSAEAK